MRMTHLNVTSHRTLAAWVYRVVLGLAMGTLLQASAHAAFVLGTIISFTSDDF